jgi:lipopolysaccharide transport system ATP-binding protein
MPDGPAPRPGAPDIRHPTAEPRPAPVLVRAENLGKCYRIYRKPLDRLLEWTIGGQRHKPFWAVRNVSFEVRRGECLGIIGANGSGKSTILKMLTGALWPTEGKAEARGRVLSLIELGTGLNPQLSGRANILNTAALLNFPPEYARETMGEIEAFAELDEFFDRPVMLYSSGMRVRLAFSMFACFRPEVFLIDEALSVGDVFFQQKCAARLREMLDGGLTMIFVSHDHAAVLNLCDSAVLMSRGRAVFQGEPQEAMSRYHSTLGPAPGARWARGRAREGATGVPSSARPCPDPPTGTAEARTPRPWHPGAEDPALPILKHDITGSRREHRHGTGHLRIVAARVTDDGGRDTLRGAMGSTLTFHVLLEARDEVPEPRAGIRFFDRLGNLVFGCGTFQLGVPIPAMAPGERRIVRFDVTMDLQPDTYTFGLGCGEPGGEGPDAGIAHDRLDMLGPIIVGQPADGKRPFYGIARLPIRAAAECAPSETPTETPP